MRFHLIDRIESWEPLQHITARKLTSVYENVWQPSATGPVLPFGLALEALCQAGAWLVLLSSGHTRRAALLTVGDVTVYRDAVPGDVLRMTAQVVHATPEAAVVDGWIDVDGERILFARNIMCALIEADRLDDPVDTERMARALLGEELIP
ncbi:hotdog family protein [Nocardia aurantiaca]|uniref:3-hydroxylacyl-ACP dehydratase n=1 Tax=Nocardia aurantiaca TaxID=2675850 RepID=A0A6I3KYD5_9NOCA|nr:3-hydroxylacyl-ACP dehydratase [Nocardia aurantiaca]MTE12539.1 3-hydroxylacyl-ACP dehydratase [Nocardia aurantiaca]